MKTKQEFKQETLEEAAESAWLNYEYENGNLYSNLFKTAFKLGAKWQQERMYSEDEVYELISLIRQTTEYEVLQDFRDKVEQFKKK